MGIVRVLEAMSSSRFGASGSPRRASMPAIRTRSSLRPIDARQLERLGPALSVASDFEHGANLEFATLDARPVLEVVVWERGAGRTLACGTGACAAVAVASAKGIVSAAGPVVVRLPGGDLEVRYDPRDQDATSMRGPARRVFAGTVERVAGR